MGETGIIYYTDNRAKDLILRTVQRILTEVATERDMDISSCSLKPIDFGRNVVLENRQRSYPTMVRQIIMALENSPAKYVFFCENDVLYHRSHFDFIPPEDDVFYYNSNVWRWRLWDSKAVTHDRMWPLSQLCVGREYVLQHYKFRERKIYEWGLDEFRSREPRRARIWGYEPGTKSTKRGGFSNEKMGEWRSEFPNVDIRHARTFSRLKCTLEDFTHPPTNWQEIPAIEIPGWDLTKVFPGKMDYLRDVCTIW